jgi:hypothetical protein
MIRTALVLLVMAGVYVAIRRGLQSDEVRPAKDTAAEAQWANEGGASAPAST